MNTGRLSWSNLKVGIVVLIGLIIFIFIVSVVGTEQNMFSSTYPLKFFLPNVQGLVNGAMVTLGGLKIGYVTDLQFTTREGKNGIEVTADVLRKYHTSITTSSAAQIKTIGLLGDKYIDITIGSQGEQTLAANAFVPMLESFDIETAGPQFKSALADFTDLLGSTKRIAASIDKGEGTVGRLIKQPHVADEMDRLLQSMNGVMDALEAQKGALGTMIYNHSLSQNIGDVAANMKTVTDQIRQGKGTMGKLVTDERLYGGFSSLAERADSLLTKVNNDTTSVAKMLNDGNFYNRLTALIQDLNLLVIDMKQHPDRYVHVSIF